MKIPKNSYSDQQQVIEIINKKKNVPLSYTRATELFLDVVTAVKMEREEFSLHNLRSGGASAAEMQE